MKYGILINDRTTCGKQFSSQFIKKSHVEIFKLSNYMFNNVMMLHVINETLRSILLSQMAEEQVGFIRGKGTREQIFKGCNII